MSFHNNQSGFTITEITVVIVLIGIASLGLITFTNNTTRQYLGLQKDATSFSDLSQQSHRITNVLRGSTDITEATDESVTVYAYFFPNNQYVSQIRYYLNPDKNVLYADVTPMTSNPPTGLPVPAQKKTYTIIPFFYQAAGSKLFEYQDSAGTNLTLPISELNTIKGIRINLQTPSDGVQDDSYQTITTQVSLRNRKTNL